MTHLAWAIFMHMTLFTDILMILFLLTGQYFGTHFIMGGERFDSPQPGEYLFGENEDLNFLGNKPVPVCPLVALTSVLTASSCFTFS